MEKINIFIIILVAIIFYMYFYRQKDHFRLQKDTLRSGLQPYIKRYDEVQNYADDIAYGLQHPVPNSAIGYSNAPWNPNSYTLSELPDGQFVGDISPN